MFADSKFMRAKEKELVFKNWKSFLRHGLKKEHFTKRLYEHLHLNCGFIAHYSRSGFYSTFFENGQDTERFFEHFCRYTAQNYGAYREYDDLNTAMRQEFQKYKSSILSKTQSDISKKLDLLEASVQQAKQDDKFAREFLNRVRM